MTQRSTPRWVAAHVPFFYGWIILGCVCCAGFSRQGGAVATLSVFVAPMTHEFGWTRAALSGAVSFGGILAALCAPGIGRMLDRHGARFVLCATVLTTGAATMLLSLTDSLLVFYLLFCVARMNFAAGFDLGIYGAINNWFVTRRAYAVSLATLAQMVGLMVLPVIAQLAMLGASWRDGWLAVGIAVLIVGLLPNWALLVRAPEDLDLLPDRRASASTGGSVQLTHSEEPAFTRAEALRTPAFWLLSLFTLLAYPVQAGVSLHQAPYLIERGLSPTIAATVISTFSFASGVATLGFGILVRRLAIRYALVLTGCLLFGGTVGLLRVATRGDAYVAAAVFGAAIGGLQMLVPLTWADYYGRRSYGAIRGVALSVQVTAQAAGPLLSGVLRDRTGSYELSLTCFAVLSGMSIVAALFAWPPRRAGREGVEEALSSAKD